MDKLELYELGRQLVRQFCTANGLPHVPIRSVPREDWHVNACAYYRPATHRGTGYATAGINICLPCCAAPATEYQVRNWNWPGANTDREPYGVLAHELGHHMDYCTGDDKWSYGSDYSKATRKASREPAVSGYCPNDAEWFAEMARMFVTNHALLYHLRPRTWELLSVKFVPVSPDDWRRALLPGCPRRVLANLEKKVRGGR